MAEEVQEQAQEENVQVQADENVGLDEKLAAIEERFKKELAGLNRRNSELEKQKADLENKYLSDQEKAERDRQKLVESLANREREYAAKDIGIPNDLIGLINGQTVDEISKSKEALLGFKQVIESQYKDRIAELESKLAEVDLVSKSTGVPKAGKQGAIDFSALTPDEAMRLVKDKPELKDAILASIK